MSKSNERAPSVSVVHIGTRASTAGAVLPGVYFRKHSRIKNVWFVDQAGQGLDTSNYVTLLLKDLAATAYATVTTSAVAAVANTPLALAYTNSDGDANSPEKDVPAGTMLNIDVAFGGTGHCVDACLLIEWYPV